MQPLSVMLFGNSGVFADLSSGSVLSPVSFPFFSAPYQHCGSINAICAAHDSNGAAGSGRATEGDGSLLVFTGSRDGTVKRWRADLSHEPRQVRDGRGGSGPHGEPSGVRRQASDSSSSSSGSAGDGGPLAAPQEQMAALLRQQEGHGGSEGGHSRRGSRRKSQGGGGAQGSSQPEGRAIDSVSSRSSSGSGRSGAALAGGTAQLSSDGSGGDRQRGAAGSRDGGARVLYEATFEAHSDWVTAVALVGRLMLSGSADCSIKVRLGGGGEEGGRGRRGKGEGGGVNH